ncbi:uncharacterized protein LOC123267386 isoform X2 [Cotesia glomerata]|uniref:uncharacterized protein LOC123267386 isoform X2 n=1 Tax=Cotesia glomerata TaxID=32391 RepID=UPI001D006696|nr:uncharacterized protein LOC123267386 isoform X2 [Cotesia glomerata]
MNSLIFGLLVAILSVNSAFSQEVQLKLKNLKTDIASNPYFENWSGEVVNDNTLSIKTPVKKDLPEDMRLSAVIEFDGNVVGDSDMTVCEAFDDETIGKDLLAKGVPDGKFPKKCPVKASNHLVLMSSGLNVIFLFALCLFQW